MEGTLRERLTRLGIVARGEPRRMGGGDIAAVYRLDTDHGALVIKRDDPRRIAGEADGLRVLREAATSLVVPEVLDAGEGWLVMEALESRARSVAGEAALGEGLRELHGHVGEAHGWPCDNACGRTPQPNAELDDGRAFQRERRLLPLAEACHGRGLMETGLRRRIASLACDLESWLPDTPASLVHGDLWSGNVLFTQRGPALIDPAVYRHYPDVDLAMLTLFGSPGEAFFEAYWTGDAPADWPRREALFQLYPLLNHVLLFGAGYLGGVERAVATLEAWRD